MFPILSTPPAAKSTSTEEPVFIVRAPRTGSSFLVKALKEVAGFAGFTEGCLTPLMTQLDSVAASYFGQARQQGMLDIPEHMIANVPEADFRQALARVFTVFRDRLSSDRRWLDKTVNATTFQALHLSQRLRLAKPREPRGETGSGLGSRVCADCEAIGTLPYVVLSLWPRAKIIYLTRDGVDNVISAERYFGVSLRGAFKARRRLPQASLMPLVK